MSLISPSVSMVGRSILIAVDGSTNSSRAFNWFIDNIWRSDDYVFIFHSAEPPKLPSLSLSAPSQVPLEEWNKIMQSRVSAVTKIDDEYSRRAEEKKLRYKFISDTSHKSGEAIVKMAKEQNVDMIVMGSRGLGSLRRTFLGSVSDYVLHHSNKPITIIPPPE